MVRVFKDSSAIDLNGMNVATVVLVPLRRQHMLQDLGSAGERDSVRYICKHRVTRRGQQFLTIQVVGTLCEILLDDPEVLTVKLQPLISIIQLIERSLQVIEEVGAEMAHGLLRQEDAVRDVVQ